MRSGHLIHSWAPGSRLTLALALLLSVGCGTTANETFYVGRFDPLNQLPQELYRFRVTGYGSWYHDVQFASGWLPAKAVDPLETTVNIDKRAVTVTDSRSRKDVSATEAKTWVEAYRTLRLFGPEAFVEVPKDLRFCVVMSGDPNKFFQAARMLTGASLDETGLLRAIEQYRAKGTEEYMLLDKALDEVNK